MNTDIDVICERCGETIHGVIIESTGIPKMTGGFYDVTVGSGWNEFSRTPSEQYVCDRCMWADPQFIAKYPVNKKIPL